MLTPPVITGPNAPPCKRRPLLPLITDANSRAGNTKLLRTAKRYPNDGYMQLIERRQVPAHIDLEPAFAGKKGPLKAGQAVLYQSKEKAAKPRVMTETAGYAGMKDFRLDYSEIEQLPSKMSMNELKKWEIQQEIDLLEADSTTSDTAETETIIETARDDARTYAELLDLYSMHEFTIRKGKTLRNTPEFASFKRHNLMSWGNIESLIQVLEEFLKLYGIDLAYIDGRKVALLASYQTEGSRIMKERDLLACIANHEDVESLLGDHRQQYFYGTTGHHLAAAKIQSAWRMYRQRIAYVHLLLGTRAVTIIQRQWAVHRAHLTTKRTIHTVKETRLVKWRQTMATFIERWPTIRHSARTIIHVPSLSFPSFHSKNIPFYTARQLGQLTRMCDLTDPNVTIVFVAPFKPEPSIIEYYETVLADAGVTNVKGRFTLLVPEDVKRLPEKMSLTRLIVLSSRVMKALKAIATGRNAYIVPGVIGPEELTLATILNIPLLSPEPRIAQVFGTKSGVSRLLESSEVGMPPGATQLRSKADVMRALAKLLVEHRDIPRWLVKIETEANSRGHAYFDAGRIKALKDESHRDLFGAVLQELEEFGSKRVRLVHPSCYPDWMTFLNMVDKVGACVVGVPARIVTNITANIFIEPTGELHLESIVEPLQAPAFTVLGSCYPCSTPLPYEAVRDASLNVARAAFRKRVIGYIAVDFILFLKEREGEEPLVRMWGVDVDLGLTNIATAHKLAITATQSVWNPETGECMEPKSQRPLCYVYSGLVYNPFLPAIKHVPFFSLCRSKGLAYDRQRRRGIFFHLIDTLLCGCMGALAIGTELSRAVRLLADFQGLLNFELPKQGEHAADSNFVYFSALIRQLTRIQKSKPS